MSTPTETTMRLNMPQWQGGNDHGYHFGSQLLAWLAPAAQGAVETVPVPEPKPGETLAQPGGHGTRRPGVQRPRGDPPISRAPSGCHADGYTASGRKRDRHSDRDPERIPRGSGHHALNLPGRR